MRLLGYSQTARLQHSLKYSSYLCIPPWCASYRHTSSVSDYWRLNVDTCLLSIAGFPPDPPLPSA